MGEKTKHFEFSIQILGELNYNNNNNLYARSPEIEKKNEN